MPPCSVWPQAHILKKYVYMGGYGHVQNAGIRYVAENPHQYVTPFKTHKNAAHVFLCAPIEYS